MQTILLGAMALASTLNSRSPGSELSLQVEVKSAAYAVRIVERDQWAIAPRGEKFLVVNLGVSNRGSTPVEYSAQAISLSVVDPENGSPVESSIARSGLSSFAEIPAGAAKTDTVVLEVPSNLRKAALKTITPTETRTIDLGPKLRPVTGAYLFDGGNSAVDEVLGNRGQDVPVGVWDIRMERVLETRQSPHPYLFATEAERFVMVEVTCKNVLSTTRTLDKSGFRSNVIDTDGTYHPWNRYMLDKAGKDVVAIELKPGKSATVVLPFILTKNFKPKTLRITDPISGRAAMIDLTRT